MQSHLLPVNKNGVERGGVSTSSSTGGNSGTDASHTHPLLWTDFPRTPPNFPASLGVSACPTCGIGFVYDGLVQDIPTHVASKECRWIGA